MASFTISYCVWRTHVPKLGFSSRFMLMWERPGKQRQKQLIGTWCANYGKKCAHYVCGCVVVMRHDESASESAVFKAGMPKQGGTNTTLSALTLSHNVHVHKTYRSGAGRRVFAGLTVSAQHAPAHVWRCLIEEGMNKSTSMAELGETVRVRRIDVPKLNKQVSCYTCEGENDLTPRQPDGEAQHAFLDLSKLNDWKSGHFW